LPALKPAGQPIPRVDGVPSGCQRDAVTDVRTEPLTEETTFTWGAPPLKFGAGASDEIGFELSLYDVHRVLVLTDPEVLASGVPHRIDTAKAVNLLTSHPGELMDYVIKPVGAATAPPGPLKPLIAVPTTAGTGSESTAMCVLDEAMVPHGQSVSLTAPAAFRFTFDTAPQRHLHAAALLAPEMDLLDDPSEQLPRALIDLMRDIGIPNGLHACGFDAGHIDELVGGTMQQQRLLSTCPKDVSEDDIAAISTESLENW